jgi:hypothetical protein
MASGLFDAPGSLTTAAVPEGDERYRAIGGAVVAAAVLAILSPLAFLDWWLAVVPVLGIVLGIVAWRDIAARPTELGGKRIAIAAIALSACALVGGLIYQSLVYAQELPPGFLRANYAMLQPLPGDPPTAIPDSARELDGRDVLLKGYMYPGKQQQGIVQFLLVRDQGDCCFGGNPKITDRVLVQLRDAKGIDFSPRLRKMAACSTISRMPLSGDRLLIALCVVSLSTGCGGPGPVRRADAPAGAMPAAADQAFASASRPASAIRDISFDDIKFDMEKGAPFTRDLLPKRVTDLERERIRIRGYILPSFQQTGLAQFVLVRDNMECCFGPGAALYDCVVVRMQPGKTADFSIRPVAVAGTFRLEELRGPDGRHLAIYALDGEDVR